MFDFFFFFSNLAKKALFWKYWIEKNCKMGQKLIMTKFVQKQELLQAMRNKEI